MDRPNPGGQECAPIQVLRPGSTKPPTAFILLTLTPSDARVREIP
jgi:hypothetical protein